MTHTLSRFVDEPSDSFGRDVAVVATVFVFRENRRQACLPASARYSHVRQLCAVFALPLAFPFTPGGMAALIAIGQW